MINHSSILNSILDTATPSSCLITILLSPFQEGRWRGGNTINHGKENVFLFCKFMWFVYENECKALKSFRSLCCKTKLLILCHNLLLLQAYIFDCSGFLSSSAISSKRENSMRSVQSCRKSMSIHLQSRI